MSDFSEFFKESFDDCREAFLSLARSTGGELSSHPVPGPDGKILFFDSLYLSPVSGKKEKLLILTSGIHGIEGFTGSALQSYFIKNILPEWRDKDQGILIIHGINPYGFINERRVTGNNVDLNRNFETSVELFRTENPGYRKVSRFLNPEDRYSRLSFYPAAVKLILKFGMETLRKAILRGQYQYQEGIFFGGKTFEPQVPLIQDLVLKVGEGYEKVLLVDLHTGYGKRGKLHLFGDRSPYIDQTYMDEVFRDLSIDYGQEKDFYSVTGGFTVFLAKLFHNKAKFAGVVFEFGTIDGHKPLGSLDSLYRMINENQISKTPGDKRLFREMFYPSSPSWRKSVLDQFAVTLASIK